MAHGTPTSPGSIALDDLTALTDEMAALVRAGVPLEDGLARAARDLTRRPGKIADAISRRLQKGESLLHVLETSPETFPPAYCAVVEAGLQTGRLPAALEGLATSSRRVGELRRLTRAAIVYPLFVAFAAYALLAYGLVAFQPQIERTYEVMEHPPSDFNLMLSNLGRTAFTWLPWIPVVALVMIAFWWYRSSRATAHDPGLLRFSPASRMLHYSRIATFADMLALLLENGAPMGRSVVLAADACGDRRLQQGSRQLAGELERGIKLSSSQLESNAAAISGFPPLLHWLLTSGGNQQALADSLRNTAEAYRRRAIRLDDWLRLYLPIGLTIGIGGTAVVVYALCTLGPWYQMLTHIATPAK
jgi:general secretion pathway protein F